MSNDEIVGALLRWLINENPDRPILIWYETSDEAEPGLIKACWLHADSVLGESVDVAAQDGSLEGVLRLLRKREAK